MIRWLLLCCLSLPVAAAIDPQSFDDPALQDRFKSLVMELRCPKCQNQAIGDSDAPIANDMRAVVAELMVDGQTDEQIVSWLEDRYGTYVRYKPVFGGSTLWLWLIPPLLLILGGIGIAKVLSRRATLTDKDRAYADELLGLKND